MKDQLKKIFTWCVIVFVIFEIIFSSPIIYAKENKVTENITLDTNSYKVFKVSNPDKNVKWTISKKKYISIVDIQGTKNSCAIVKTGKKMGTCVLKAKTAKKAYVWKISVKKDKKSSKAMLLKVKQTDTQLNVTIKLSNMTKKWMEYGEGYCLEKIRNGRWKKIKMNEEDYEYEVPSVAYSIPSKGSVKKIYRLASWYNRKDLKKGIYRITVNADFSKKSYSKVIFEVK